MGSRVGSGEAPGEILLYRLTHIDTNSGSNSLLTFHLKPIAASVEPFAELELLMLTVGQATVF